MTDVVSPKKRSEMMAGIRGSDTTPELRVRRALFSMGYRYRLHRKDLPGTPDIVLPARRVAIFVNGCFWHGHAGCRFAKIPSTRTEFWTQKFEQNRQRDRSAVAALLEKKWRVLVVWECFTRKSPQETAIAVAIKQWMDSTSVQGELDAIARPEEPVDDTQAESLNLPLNSTHK